MGVGGDKLGLLSFNFHLRNQRHGTGGGGGGGGGSKRHISGEQAAVETTSRDAPVPKGCLAIKVGEGEEHQLQRFVVPVMYFKHPLFLRLLKVAEEVYGFDQKGTITIPCHVDEFRYVQALIDKDMGSLHHHHQQAHHQHHHGTRVHRLPIAGCFRA
ncbi:Auxin-responsive protein saur32 [Dionaea muscipula]